MSGRRTSGRVKNPVILLGLEVPVVRWMTDVRSFQGLRTSGKVTVVRWSGSTRDFRSGTQFWAEFGDFGVKIDEISWMESGENWGNARSTRNQANPWIKINKTSSNKQITKKIGGYFWWGFSDLGRNQQNQARKQRVGAPKT